MPIRATSVGRRIWPQKIAAFYRGKIDALEVFDERDVMELVPEDYALILRACYAKVKAVSDVPLVSAGICCGQALDYLTRVLEAAPNSFDQIGWHLLGQRIDNFPSANWGVGDLRDFLTRARVIAGRPLWVTEIGADLRYPWPKQPSPEQGVAEYFRRSLTLIRELGPNVVAHAYWFTWKRPDCDFGLVDNRGGRRAGWYVFQELSRVPPPPVVQIMGVNFSPVSLQPHQTLNVVATVRNNSAPLGLACASRAGRDAHDHGTIRLARAQSQNYWEGLVRERLAWIYDRVEVTAIQLP